MSTQLTTAQADRLLQLARETIDCKLDGRPMVAEPPGDPQFHEDGATFVTLKIGGQLRGCIGNLEPSTSLWDSVKKNAVSAAFHDHRFSPLSRDEFKRLHIEVSILTRPQPLAYRDGEDLALKLRPGVDGVILRLGRAGATFLPQVWEQLPTAELFLNHLCRKAGLAGDCWRSEHPAIEVYQVNHFEEPTT